MRRGIELEVSFLRQAQQDYPECNPQKAPLDLDRHFSTDVLLEIGGRIVPIGLTRRHYDFDGIISDWAKASRRFTHWVEVVVPDQEPEEEQLAIDNAMDWLTNEFARHIEEYEKSYVYLTALAEGVVDTELG
jgi:hypothetical protein